jgi:hypothetical protein
MTHVKSRPAWVFGLCLLDGHRFRQATDQVAKWARAEMTKPEVPAKSMPLIFMPKGKTAFQTVLIV